MPYLSPALNVMIAAARKAGRALIRDFAEGCSVTLVGSPRLAGLAEAEGCRLSVTERRGQGLAYAKGGEAIVDLLALVGAGQTALLLDEHAVLAGTRSEANRMANADAANVGRVVRASREQIDAIEALAGHVLPPHLAEVAELRLRHPSLSLAELGFDPLMGARPMQRLIQDMIRRALADELLFGRLTDGGRLTVDLDDKDEVTLDIQPPRKSDKPKAETTAV